MSAVYLATRDDGDEVTVLSVHATEEGARSACEDYARQGAINPTHQGALLAEIKRPDRWQANDVGGSYWWCFSHTYAAERHEVQP